MKSSYFVLSTVTVLFISYSAIAQNAVQFADPNLKIVVEAKLGITDPTPTDMLLLYNLEAMSKGITDITGLEYAENLHSLDLRFNQIADIEPLSGLTNLGWLGIYSNRISDLSPLSNLTSLYSLDPGINQIIDISALANLVNLNYLDLTQNQISDISALSGLNNLTRLYLSSNHITDISSLQGLTNLVQLDLGRNQITDINDLSGLSALEGIWLHENQISDISVLTGFTNLTTIWLQQNPLNDNAYCTDLAAIIANNPSLTTLEYTPNSNPPAGLTASDGTYADKVQITWNQLCNGPNYNSFYQVYRSDSAAGAKSAISSWQSGTTFDDTTAAVGTIYTYWVHAATSDQGEYNADYSIPDTGFVSGTQLPQQTCTITGMKWNDTNGDVSSSGEQGLVGWTIFAEPATSANGQLDANEVSTITDQQGDFTISGLPPGTYRVREVLQNGWVQTFPAQGFHEITCSGNQTVTNINFGNCQTELPDDGDDGGGGPVKMWSQTPIEIDPDVELSPLFCGWTEPARSTEQTGQRRQWRMDADDFRCFVTVPVTGLRWWGSYKAWGHSEPPELQPMAWHISIWANQIEGIIPEELFPERPVWLLEIPPERVHFEPAGLNQFPQQIPSMCFVYEVQLEPDEWFNPAEFDTNESVFWISITAVYPTDAEQMKMWGWFTRPHIWGKGGVMPAIMGEWPTYDERLFPGRIYPIENSLMCGQNQPYDLCFELLTDRTWIKWAQSFTGLRDWGQYSNYMSTSFKPEGGELSPLSQVADDWICENSEPVTAVTWNGSYIGYSYQACSCVETTEPRRPDYFLLSICTDASPDNVGQNHHPGGKIWEYAAYDYDEVFVGYDRNSEGRLNEAVFHYLVRLVNDAYFQSQLPGSIYWFSVEAVFEGPIGEIPYQWGWTSHPYMFGTAASMLDNHSASSPRWTECLDMNSEPVDMSFMFFTTPEH